jgi:hypothetical protein
MMPELRKLFLFITDEHDISIKTSYIRSASNVWAYRLNRETDNADWQLATHIFRYYDKKWGSHSINRFASFANKQLPRYNVKWRDGRTKAVNSIHLPDRDWHHETSWCNPP